MEGHPHPKGTASDTLDRIRRGGTHLILAAQRWLAETKALLDDGDFQAAMKTAAQLREKIAALAVAEGSLGSVSDARILKCRDVEVGMNLAEVGEVTAIEPCIRCKRINQQNGRTRPDVKNHRHTRLCTPTTRRDSRPHE